MKTIMLVFVMTLFAGMAFGQLKKGSLISIHVEDVKLAPGATMEQYIDFLKNKYVPEYEKAFGSKVHIVKGVRGEKADKYGFLIMYDSEAARNKYFKDDGSGTEAGKAATKKMESLNKELEKLGTSDAKYTDWVVQ
jgi:hypothetical protein